MPDPEVIQQGVVQHNDEQHAYASGTDAAVRTEDRTIHINPVDEVEKGDGNGN